MANFQKTAPCKYRYRIYETQLVQAYEELEKLARLPKYKAMQKALKDKRLMTQLAEILDEYVICGVSADLGRLRPPEGANANDPRAKHLAKKPPAPPNLDQIIDVNVGITFDKVQNGDPKTMYQNYFDWYILTDQVVKNGQPIDGRAAFYARYPRIKHAVDTLSRHFVENIREACDRLAQDWATIRRVFFASEPAGSKQELVEITPTGSDFHKGGKQVLILSFRFGRAARRLVYKPGDVELDYRLLADTGHVRADRSLSRALGQQQSLWELTNEFLDDDFKLPTYRILPRNPGSKLVAAAGRLSIHDSYGYIEFLSNDPKAKKDGDPVGMPAGSDWVTQDKRDVEKFYRQWGRILAIAFMFSMSDIHLDNVIVHKLQPHLIDAEIAFTGPMDDVTGTVALRHTTGALRAEADRSPRSIRQRDRDEERTANLYVDDELAMQLYDPSRNRLILAKNGKFEQTLTKHYMDLLCIGFSEVLHAFAAKRPSLLQWLNNTKLDQVVARFTPMSTAEFSEILRLAYSPTHCSRDLAIGEEPFSTKKQQADNDWTAQVGDKWPAPRPNHALFAQEHVFEDIRNCDVPAFYHRLGSQDLLNARGEIVNIPAGNVRGRDHYFPKSTLSIVEQKIALLNSIDVVAFVDDLARKLLATFEPSVGVSDFIATVFPKEL